MEKDAAYFSRALQGLQTAAERSRQESGPEEAVRHITEAAREVMGNADAAKAAGALKPGERDFKVSGIFFASPARDHLILMADHDFPPEQRFLRISIADSRPGYTVRTGTPVVVSNTDHDGLFRQILKTARMGSAVYAPMVWKGNVIGMFNVAAQARNTYDETDLTIAMAFASLASATWMAFDGPRYLSGVTAALPRWTHESPPPTL